MARLPRCETLEPRTLLSSVRFGLVDGRAVIARLAPEAGVQLVATLKGPGVGTATVDGGRVDLLLEGTSGATTVTLKSTGRSPLRLGDVTAPGALGWLKAPTADASGVFTLTGGVGAIDLRSASGLMVEAGGADVGALRVGAAGAKRAARGAVGDFVGQIEAHRLSALAVGGSATLDARVQFADSIAVGGDLTGSTITAMPADEGQDAGLGHLSVGGTMRAVKVVAMGDVGTVRAGAMVDSEVMAGVRYAPLADGTFEHVLPAESYGKDFDFTGKYRVGAVQVTGIKSQRKPARARKPRALVVQAAPAVASWFSNSRIAAYDVGDVVLDGVGGFNNGRAHGVAAFRVGSVVRRFADPLSPNPGGDFAVRQTSEQLVYREGPNGFGGYLGTGYATISLVDNIVDQGFGQPTASPSVDIPATGAVIGSASVTGQSATLYLMPDGAYEVRAGSEAPLAHDASLAALILSVAATPGTSLKLIHRPAAGSIDGSAQFLSTSVSGSVTLKLPAHPLPYRSVVTGGPSTWVIGPVGMPVFVPGVISETLYTVPTVSELTAALQDGGTEVRTFDRDLLLVKPEGKEVGRVFDDTGLRKVVLTAQNTFRLTNSEGGVLWEGADLLTALVGPGPRLGLRRLPARLVGKPQVYLYGLARGGTAVFDVGGQTTLDPVGNIDTLPSGNDIAERLRQVGFEFVGYDV